MLEQLFLLLNGIALIWSVYLVGSDNPKGWPLGILAEASWLVWVVAAGFWGLIPCASGLLVMNIRGWWKHRKSNRPKFSFNLREVLRPVPELRKQEQVIGTGS